MQLLSHSRHVLGRDVYEMGPMWSGLKDGLEKDSGSSYPRRLDRQGRGAYHQCQRQ